jgi:hypothetical protein
MSRFQKIMFILFIVLDMCAFFSVPKPNRSHWQYITPGGGFIALYQYAHNQQAP